MAWSARFVADIEAQVMAPMFRLERQKFGSEAGGDFAIYSHSGHPRIRRVRCEGHRLEPATVGTTWGKFVVEVVGDDLSNLHELVARGTFVVLYAGFPGYADADYQPIGIGCVRNVKGYRPAWVIEVTDLATGLRQRPGSSAFNVRLFDGVDSTTTLNAAYGAADTTITVLSTSGFSKQDGGTGAIRITPTTGTPFYKLWSASTGTTFTVATGDVMGTAAVSAVGGDLVEEVAYLYGHPMDFARRVLCSTGTAGANGTYDVLPTNWGLAVPQGLVDNDDTDDYRDRVVGLSGSYTWAYPQVGTVEEGLDWLHGWLGAAGMYVTTRQGRVTVRALQSTTAPIARLGAWAITDADIIGVVAHEWWYSAHAPEYSRTRAWSYDTGGGGVTATLSTTTTVYNAPKDETREWDISDRVFTSTADYRQELLNRLTEVGERTPELLTLRCAGLRLSQLAPGDLVNVTTSRVHSRVAGGALTGRTGMVIQVSADWTSPVVEVSVVLYPLAGDTWA